MNQKLKVVNWFKRYNEKPLQAKGIQYGIKVKMQQRKCLNALTIALKFVKHFLSVRTT